jgi:hypothetical protein
MEGKRKKYSNRPLEITGQIGVLVRQISKLCRLHNMITNDIMDHEENILDTKMDIFNYCVIGFELMIGSQIQFDLSMIARKLMMEIHT